MKKQSTLKTFATAFGAVLATCLMSIPVAGAAENPFGMTKLSDGFMIADKHMGGADGGLDVEQQGLETTGDKPSTPPTAKEIEKETMGADGGLDAEQQGKGSKYPRPPTEATQEDVGGGADGGLDAEKQ